MPRWTLDLSTHTSAGVLPPVMDIGVFEVRARARVSLGRGDVQDAASNGHLECLKYAREHGCPWDEEDVRVCRRMDSWSV